MLPELIGAIAATQDANFAARLVPRDEVFGAIVLGEGEVSTVSPHPLWVVAALALETVEAIEAGLSAAQQVSDFCYGSWTTALINHFVQKTDVKLHVTEIKTLGCSQGYWKNHTELWDSAIAGGGDLAPAYDPSDGFDTVFGDGADGQAGLKNNATLLDTLSAKGGGTTEQARNAVTLLLNNDALDHGFTLPCDEPAGDVGPFFPIAGPFERHFVLSATESGEPVEVEVIDVHASEFDPANLQFFDITPFTTTTPAIRGIQSVDVILPPELRNVRAFQIKVMHDHGATSIDANSIFGKPPGVEIKHFGSIFFHQDHMRNIEVGQ